MNNAAILQQYAFQRMYISFLVDDIADEQIVMQPWRVVNHPAWQLGHLAVVTDRMNTTLGNAAGLDAAWGKQYGPNSTPIADRSAYPSRTELVRILDERRNALAKSFEKASSDDLAKPNPIATLTKVMPTIGILMLFGMLTHESTHLGQLATWRSAMGMPMAFLKMQR